VKLVYISCAWVLGIFMGSLFRFPFALILLGLLPLPLILFLKNRITPLVLAALSLVFFFGAGSYYPSSLPDESSVAVFNNQGVVELKVKVDGEPQVKDKVTHLQISVHEIKTGSDWQPARGSVLVFIPRYPEYSYGDALWIKGTLEDPPKFETFDYQAYLSRQGIYSTMRFAQIKIMETNHRSGPAQWLYSFRQRLSQSLAAALPEPQASLAQGIVLGIRTTIPDQLKDDLSITGTAHLLAISGMNLTIITGILVSLGLLVFGRRHYYYVWITLAAIWIYALITGMEAPVVRSAIMATVFLTAELLGRQKSAFVALAFSAAIMVGLDPSVLWSPSFQLSFLSMIGLVFVAPWLRNKGRQAVHAVLTDESIPARISCVIVDAFSISLAAIIAVWPLIAYYFGIVSLVGPLATVLISPVFPAIIVCGTLTTLLGIISPPVAHVFGWTAWLFISYMLGLVNAFASLPFASIRAVSVNVSLVWTYYGILIILIYTLTNFKKLVNWISDLNNKTKTVSGWALGIFSILPKKYVIAPLLVTAMLVSLTAFSLPDKKLHISFLDVGEGDAILIQNNGQNILIDGGPSPQAVCLGLGKKLPFWERDLDLVILTHPHLDHLNGLIEVLKRYKVKQVLTPALTSDSPPYQEWLSVMDQKNIPCIAATAGQTITLANDVIMNVLCPPDVGSSAAVDNIDEYGLVLRLTRDQISFLFTADIGQETELRLVRQRVDLFCTVLKVAHHGSGGSTSAEFLTQAGPQSAVISVGSANTFGHPDEQVLGRLVDNIPLDNDIYRTDLNGTIEFITDGTTLRVKTDH
jgi:competence protein ComEC